MIQKSLIKQLIDIVGVNNLLINEPMSLHTTFKIGGPADVFVTPNTPSKLSKVLSLLNLNNVPFFLLGRGSNLVVSDKGIRGVVICTNHVSTIRKRGKVIVAHCGVKLSDFANYTARQGLTGLEFACGIPGSVGGAVFMNAGAYDSEISKVLKFSKIFNLETNIEKTISWTEHNFSYRHSVCQEKPYIILSSTFELKPQSKLTIKSRIDQLTREREEKQPLDMPSAGSVFRRPEGYYTGKLIEECGLKGFRIGGAEVSTKHCGFIVNAGNATAHDVKSLVEHIQTTIFAKYGVMLQTEIKFIGEI